MHWPEFMLSFFTEESMGIVKSCVNNKKILQPFTAFEKIYAMFLSPYTL
jgi:hypothetical protein